MLSILRERLPADEATVRAALERYLAALEAHKSTIGEPAPWPDHDLLFEIVRAGGQFVVVDEPQLEAVEPTPDHMRAILAGKVQNHLDAHARAYGYDSIFTAVTYAEEDSVPKFQAEARAFRRWRSLVWLKCEEVMAAVLTGERPIPTEAELLAELPPLVLSRVDGVSSLT